MDGGDGALTTACVTGAGGFIGHHLVRDLKRRGFEVRGVDVKRPEFEATAADEFLELDLREYANCVRAADGAEHVYALAADMGGMGYISAHHAKILRDNSLINQHTLEAARVGDASRYFYASSACVYPEYRQEQADVTSLREDFAYPAQPQDAYGWEKLVSERLAHHYLEDYGLETRVARFHNVYGPLGTWRGGREKAPAALCRKIAHARWTGETEIEIWGDGEQTRSFCFIDDCIVGIERLVASNHSEPINLGSDRLISINDLADLIAGIAGIDIERRHVEAPQGVPPGATPTTPRFARRSAGPPPSPWRTASRGPTAGSRPKSAPSSGSLEGPPPRLARRLGLPSRLRVATQQMQAAGPNGSQRSVSMLSSRA